MKVVKYQKFNYDKFIEFFLNKTREDKSIVSKVDEDLYQFIKNEINITTNFLYSYKFNLKMNNNHFQTLYDKIIIHFFTEENK